MTHARSAIAGLALLVAAAAPARAQHRAPRWGGGGAGVSPGANQQQMHAHVSYQGPSLSMPGAPLTGAGNSAGQASGGSWDGRRPTWGGSPAARPEQQGQDLSGFFGYVPARGQNARNVPVQSVMPAVSRTSVQTAQPPALRSTVQAPKTDVQQHHPQITWP